MSFLSNFFAPADYLYKLYGNTIGQANPAAQRPHSQVNNALNLLNPFDKNTLATSRQAPGGYLVAGARSTAPSPDGTAAPSPDGTAAPDPGTTGQSLQDLINALTGRGSGGSGGTATKPTQLPSHVFNGVDYGGDYVAYLNAINQEIDNQLGSATGQATRQTQTQKGQLSTQLDQALKDLGTQTTQGQNNIDAYYSGLGDLYQSGQGVRQQDLTNQAQTQDTNLHTNYNQTNSALDQALQDYISGAQQSANSQRDTNANSAADLRNTLAFNPDTKLQSVNPFNGQVTMPDTSALLAHLNNWLSPSNLKQRYTQPNGGASNVYGYLNPTG